jgi:hypothetical protein
MVAVPDFSGHSVTPCRYERYEVKVKLNGVPKA